MKTALVLSGGGAKGAFQAGAIQELHRQGLEYHSVAGVSVGALNGVMVAAHKIPRLIEIWESIRQDDVYKKNSIPKVSFRFLLHKIGIKSPPKSIYTNEPLLKLLKREFKNIELNMPLYAGRVNLETGEYTNNLEPDGRDFERQILASTAIPVIWKPVELNNELFVDGGVRNTTPLKDVIEDDPDRIVIITNGPLNKLRVERGIRDILEIAERSLNILLDEIFVEDINHCVQINNLVKQAEEQGVTLRSKSGRPLKNFELTIITPSESLGSALDFDRERLDSLLEMGRAAARQAMDETA